ncbi:YceI family protein [Paludibacterium paludis]|uniref:Polyisoprenoid-binding protein n=1 Tax=Paludibacterium paludis TaxID=1225769 RepID=A0A918UB99_9NEIS|nr:YceI family protein [Paludibacterium paludis]GGY27858.1 polyisoprenoid-binding protein [Paludibacterium paludis]
MIKLIAVSLSTLSLAAAVQAAPATYAVDPSHTYAQYTVNHLGFSEQIGLFAKVGGTVTLDTEARDGAVDIKIDAASLQTFWAARDKHLKGPDFFNVEKYPSLTFTSDKLVFAGETLSEVQGKLTLLGVTRPVTLKVTHFKGGKNPMSGIETYGANAETVIRRSEFGMKTYVPAIADEVKLNIVIEAQRTK